MKITIIGAGISGLLSAYYLLGAGFEVEIFEESKRPGGLIQTLETPYGPMDYAASSWINSVDLEELFEQIGLNYAPKSQLAGVKNIYRHGMKRWPLNPMETARMAVGAAGVLFNRDKGLRANQTVREWGEAALGKAGYTYLLETFLQGVYAGDCSKMSAALVLEPMLSQKQKRNKKPRLRGSVMPRGGMGQFIEKLAEYLEKNGVRINYQAKVQVEDLPASDQIVIATSATAAGKLLTRADVAAGPMLGDVQMLDLAGVHLVFEEEEPLFRGFGCLFPVGEGFNSLGVLAGKNAFPDEYPYPVERWFMGGAHSPDMLKLSDAELIDLALRDREKISGQFRHPIKTYVLRREKSLPHYTPALKNILTQMELPQNIHLVGNYTGGIGLTAIMRACQSLAIRVSKANP